MKQKGFTLIELLIVIALISILAVAILSTIDPVEQMKKARDSARKADSAELLHAYERYYSTYGCYPWEGGAGATCTDSTLAVTNPSFAVSGNSEKLLPTYSGEIKTQFQARDSISNVTAAKRLYISETTASSVSVCYEPESKSARTGGQGPLKDNVNVGNITSCGATYPGGVCFVCVPQ